MNKNENLENRQYWEFNEQRLDRENIGYRENQVKWKTGQFGNV